MHGPIPAFPTGHIVNFNLKTVFPLCQVVITKEIVERLMEIEGWEARLEEARDPYFTGRIRCTARFRLQGFRAWGSLLKA